MSGIQSSPPKDNPDFLVGLEDNQIVRVPMGNRLPVTYDPATGQQYAGSSLVSGYGIRTTPVRIATLGDSTANTNSSIIDMSVVSTTFATRTNYSISPEKFALPDFYPQAYLVGNGGISGQTTTQILARDASATGSTRKAIQDVLDLKPDIVIVRAGSPNDLATVTSGTISSVVASTYANHVEILNRLLSAGVYIIDEGLYGYSGSGHTEPASTRAAIMQLEALYDSYAAQFSSQIYRINWTGILRDSTGAFLPNCCLNDGQGLHLSFYGQRLAAQQEAAILRRVFGASASTRYQGVNVLKNAATAANGGNSLMASTTSPGYGTVPTGFTWGVSNGTRQNAKVEVVNGKKFATCEIAPTNASTAYLNVYAPLDAANFAPAIGDVYAVEFDWLLAPLSGQALPAFSLLKAQFDFTSGGNNIVVNALQTSQSTTFPADGSVLTGHVAFPPFQFPADTSTLTLAEVYVQFTSADGIGWKMGIGNPRLVKL